VNCVCPGLTDTPLIAGARAQLEAVGFPLIPPSDIAAAVVACMTGDASGEAYVCQAGRPPVAFEFHGVPGPRGGLRPAEGLRGVAYVGSGDGKLYAFAAAGCGASTCAPLWTAATGGPIYSSPAVAGGTVYVGSNDDKLYAFAASGCGAPTCAALWTGTTPGDV